mmetsp:Transcript_26321/g.42636  ORF Transcript_26321/g.42636 Transcript_26321/m.42636 type:complete len:457 (-) Transcript_26321:13-1383(-)
MKTAYSLFLSAILLAAANAQNNTNATQLFDVETGVPEMKSKVEGYLRNNQAQRYPSGQYRYSNYGVYSMPYQFHQCICQSKTLDTYGANCQYMDTRHVSKMNCYVNAYFGNRIDSISNFHKLEALTIVGKGYYSLGYVAAGIFSHPPLRHLDLRGHRNLRWLQPFTRYNNLKHLVIRQCGIYNLPWTMFDMSRNLQKLDLAENYLYSIPSVGNLKSLVYINLASNRLAALPYNFGYMCNLRWMDATNNYLSNLPYTFGNLKALGACYLDGNRFYSLPGGYLKGLKSLKYFSVSRNSRLTSIPKEIYETPVKNVYADKCPIKCIDPYAKTVKTGVNAFDGYYFGSNAQSEYVTDAQVKAGTPYICVGTKSSTCSYTQRRKVCGGGGGTGVSYGSCQAHSKNTPYRITYICSADNRYQLCYNGFSWGTYSMAHGKHCKCQTNLLSHSPRHGHCYHYYK